MHGLFALSFLLLIGTLVNVTSCRDTSSNNAGGDVKRLLLQDDQEVVDELLLQQAQIKNLSSIVHTQAQDKAALTKQVMDLKNELHNFTSMWHVMHSEVVQDMNGISRLDTELQSQTETIESLTRDKVALTNQVRDLQNELHNFTAMWKVMHHEVVTDMNDINTLTLEVAQLQSQSVSGDTYTRWGRTSCPGNTSLLYSGFMSGTEFTTDTGNGGNFLCLTDKPLWDHYTTEQNNGIVVTAVEYDFNPYHDAASLEAFLGSDVYGDQVPCSLCYTPRAATVMIPGRNQCYPGWKVEYQGYIVTGYPGYADSTEYVCMDRRPESVVGSEHVDSRNTLYFVEALCGNGLECPPYENGRELTCVVCSTSK